MNYCEIFYKKELEIIETIYKSQLENIKEAANIMVDAIASGHLVYVFGSAHSAMPAMEIFPRYGSYVGEKGAFHPLLNPRLLWWNVVGTGGVKDLLWLERQNGYIANYLDEQDLKPGDVLWVFSHGGVNAAPVEAATYAKERGMKVIAVTSLDNQRLVEKKHPEIKKISDIADIIIDNCVPLEDALVPLEEHVEKVSAGSTIAAMTVVQLVNAQVAGELVDRGVELCIFVSPNVTEIPPTHNQEVFKKYDEIVMKHKNIV